MERTGIASRAVVERVTEAVEAVRRDTSPLADVDIELTRIVFDGLMPTLVLAVVGMVGTIARVAFHFDDRFMWWMTISMLLFCCARIGVTFCFATRSKTSFSLREAYIWQALYGILTLGYCCIMARTTIHTFVHYPIAGSRLSMVGTFCVCVGLGNRVGMRPLVVQTCGLVMLVTLGVCVWRTHGLMSGQAVLLIGFFTYQFCSSTRSQFDSLVEQLRSRRKLRALAEQDGLTGLANRRHFQNCLNEICSRDTRFAILYIDLDRFKSVNDTLGHAAGDALLVQVAGRLGGAIRSTDLLARLGGDEFAILQTPLDGSGAASALAERINRAIAEPFVVGGSVARIGASVGIQLSDHREADPNTILSKADKALYQVKMAGGGGFCLAGA